MKPDLKMEETKVPVNVVVQPKAEKERGRSGQKMLIGGVAGIVTLLAIAGIIVGAYYIGAKSTKEANKQAAITINGMVSYVEANRHEEVVDTVGGAKVVRNFQSGLETMRIGVGASQVCIVSPMISQLHMDTERLLHELHDDDINTESRLKVSYTSRMQAVNQYVLSEAAKEMCADLPTFWATLEKLNATDEDLHRHKRNCNGFNFPTYNYAAGFVAYNCGTTTDTVLFTNVDAVGFSDASTGQSGYGYSAQTAGASTTTTVVSVGIVFFPPFYSP